jgi:uncharacterized protein (TIGR04255 family)
MPPRQIYPNPPIAEAILDITTAHDARQEIDTTWLSTAEFPLRQPLMQARVEIGVQPPRFEQEFLGILAESSDHKSRIQVRRNGLSMHRLAPYTTWDDQVANLRRHWSAYRSAVGAHQIQRLGVRYVNKIPLPSGFSDFGEYVRTIPLIADGLNTSLSSMLMRLEIPYPERQATVLLTEVVAREGGGVFLILDIDAVRLVPVDEAELWEALSGLHDLENDIFESSITDAARRLFQ